MREPATARDVLAQRKRSHAGNVAERVVESQHRALAMCGVATMYRVPTPVAVIGKVQSGIVCRYTEKSTVDYIGHTPEGRVVMTEVKHIGERLLTSGKPALPSMGLERVAPHQARALDLCVDAGGLGVLLIVYHGGEALFACPWKGVRGHIGTLRGEALEQYRVAPGRLYLPLRGAA